jgi:hypothetical protein
LNLVRLCLVGITLMGIAGCAWDHGRDRGSDRGAGYSDQRSDRDMRNQHPTNQPDEERMHENRPLQENRPEYRR